MAWGGVAYAAWAMVIVLVAVVVCSSYILKSLIDSEYEKGCSDPKTKEQLDTTKTFTIAVLATSGVILLISLIFAIIGSVKSLGQKTDTIKELFKPN